MERENRLLGIGALFTCLTIPLMLCAAVVVFSFGLNPFSAARTSAPALPAVQRLALIGDDGNVYIVDQNGESKVAITSDAKLERSALIRRVYAFPNWSPDSQRLAFVGLSSENNGKAYLYTASAKDGQPQEVFSSEDQVPFYLSWSPDGQHIAYLSQGNDDLTLNYSNADGSDRRELGKGSPWYFAWSPDSQMLLSHVGGSRRQSADAFIGLHSLAKSDALQHLSLAPANFLAPTWSPDGTELLLALMGSNNTSDALIVTDRQGEHARTLVTFSGNISFAWSPDGKQIAYLVTQRTGSSFSSELRVIKPDGSDQQLLSDETPISFFWSPDSQKIAYLVRARGDQGALQFARSPTQQGTLRLAWKVITLSDKKITSLPTFVPTDAFATLLPYFDQYAQSLRLWSPDSQKLVYGAEDKDGEGIYLIDVSGQREARRIGAGSIAVWSWR